MGKQKSKHSTKSKRTLRKQLRLKGHQGLERQNPLDLLEAVSASTVEIEDPNLEILPAKKVKKTPFDSGVVDQTEQRKFSKAQLRKKKQVEARKAQRETLQGLLETLKKHELTNEQRQLLSLTKDMGKRVSRRQELTMHLKLQKMGLPLPKGSRLYQRSQQEEDNNDNSVAEDVEVEESDVKSDGVKDDNEILLEDDQDGDSLQEISQQQAGKRQHLQAMSESEIQTAKRIRKELGLEQSVQKEANADQLQQTQVLLHRVVHFKREKSIEEIRRELPVYQMEQEIMEMILYNDVCVISGETGSGKTTQVPQFLLEAGYGNIQYTERSGTVGVTQPRRVAAVAAAERVATELNTSLGQDIVGYQVRYDRKVGEHVSLKFMTDGILLREMQEDFLLRKYSVLIVDEAHERSLCSDLLLGMLSRCIPLRRKINKPLKLVIMSATLRVQDFTGNPKLFSPPPPVINVDVRQFPVYVHFSRVTELGDYINTAYRKTCRIHRELPHGGILVFVTGQREVNYLVKKLNATFNRKRRRKDGAVEVKAEEEESEQDHEEDQSELDDFMGADRAEIQNVEEEGRLDDDFDEMVESDYGSDSGDEKSQDEEEVQILGGENWTEQQLKEAEEQMNQTMLQIYQGGEDNSDDKTQDKKESDQEDEGMVHVLPLFAMLPKSKQELVFKHPPKNRRLIVVATNVAETSLTIPGIRYVVDAGRSKQKILESSSGMARYEVRWISKASAAQRSGRAGRTGPGHCYRLYSSAHFNNSFPEYTFPEIINTPLEGVVLMMKSMRVPVQGFVFPTQPASDALFAAEQCLKSIGAVQNVKNGQVTSIGKQMSKLPIGPRHARMLVEVLSIILEEQLQNDQQDRKLTNYGKLLLYAIMLAACLSVESPFVHIEHITKPQNEANQKDNEQMDQDQKEGRTQEQQQEELQQSQSKADRKQQKQELKKIRQQARKLHDQFRSSDSDAIQVLKALLAFEMQEQTEDFCRQHYLHFRILKEADALNQQLKRIVKQSWGSYVADLLDDYDQNSQRKLSSPSSKMIKQLKRALAAGWSDQVCRRMRSAEYLSKLQEEGRYKAHAVCYQHCRLEENNEVYLHPRSALHQSAPEYVVYTELLQTEKRTYMAGVSSIYPGSLSQLRTPIIQELQLQDPSPYFCTKRDCSMAYYSVSYGLHAWPLPIVSKPLPMGELAVSIFAAALLKGEIWSHWEEHLGSILVGDPAVVQRKEGKVLQRVQELIHRLYTCKIASKEELQAKWSTDVLFLKSEIEMWIKDNAVKEFRQQWKYLVQLSLHD
eukprot:TRINITY_DN7141_c0_g1_i3.p1 TRINITY_DN7141_c0_g1~~TRINITY_DN7141_c0_g1_i3.p1  ORF type:complete len:1286 (-),score=169.44 TRINITY_DN7141_c0_g1_i3:373-4230(-)